MSKFIYPLNDEEVDFQGFEKLKTNKSNKKEFNLDEELTRKKSKLQRTKMRNKMRKEKEWRYVTS